MKRSAALAAVFLLVCAALWSQEEKRPGWIYSSGSGSAAGEQAAVRAAKGDALRNAFADLGKDGLFESIFISDWPDAVVIYESTIAGDAEQGFSATVEVGIDQNALILAEGPYTAAATGLLNRAEALVSEADVTARKGGTYEAELDIQLAFGRYRNAESLLSEATILLSPLQDDTVFSDEGGNISSLRTTIESLSGTVQAGLVRIERVSADIEAEQGRRQYVEVLTRLEKRLATAEAEVESYIMESPFYDLPAEELERYRNALDLTRADLESIVENLESVRSTLPNAEELAWERVDIGLANADRLSAHTQRMIDAVQREIAYPRLERQEDAARRSRRRAAVGNAVRWTFLHRPSDYLSYTYELPFVVDHRDGSSRFPAAGWQLQAEATFNPGIWLHTRLANTRLAGSSALYRKALSQAVGVGIVGRRIWGLGFSWDWWATDDEDTTLRPEQAVTVYLGKANPELRRADIMLSLKYRLPGGTEDFVPRYHLNGRFDAMMRVEQIILLEGMVQSQIVTAIADTVANPTAEQIRSQPYQLEWRAGVGLRLPPPVALKVFYGATYEQGAGSADTELQQARRGWTFAIEYTI